MMLMVIYGKKLVSAVLAVGSFINGIYDILEGYD